MSARSPWWIDWALARRALVAEVPGRFLLLFLAAGFYFALLLSGGADRFLAGRWTVTVVLSRDVSAAEGAGIALGLGRLSAVQSAVYRDPEEAWKEFSSAYPGLEVMREAGGNPLPGYVEIRFRPNRFEERDVDAVIAVLRPLPQVEAVLSGSEGLARLLWLKNCANACLWGAFGVLCATILWIFALQEKARAGALAGDVAFLSARGATPAAIGRRRAASAGIWGAVLGAAAAAAAVGLLGFLLSAYPFLRTIAGRVEELAAPPLLFLAAAFPAGAALVSCAASAAGWLAARRKAR